LTPFLGVATYGMLPAAGQGHRLLSKPCRSPSWQGQQGSPHDASRSTDLGTGKGVRHLFLPQEAIRSILGMLSIWKGARTYGRVLSGFTEDELLELENQAFGTTEHETG